jgi:hypothetical protein
MKRFMAAMLAAMLVACGATAAIANDAQIAQQIVAKLRQQQEAAQLKGFSIGVQVDQGTVTMLGQVADQDQATLALEIARRIPGVKLVINDLQIRSREIQSDDSAPLPRPIAGRRAARKNSADRLVMAQYAASATGPAYAAPQSFDDQPMSMSGPPTGIEPAYASQPPQSILRHTVVGSGASRPRPAPQTYVAQAAPVPYAPAASFNRRAVAAQYEGAVVPGGEIITGDASGAPMPVNMTSIDGGMAAPAYDSPQMPGYAWPSYATYPNYGAVTYPQQYSATAWPYIGPFYPYPQVPLGWRKVMLEWDDGWWFLDFKAK